MRRREEGRVALLECQQKCHASMCPEKVQSGEILPFLKKGTLPDALIFFISGIEAPLDERSKLPIGQNGVHEEASWQSEDPIGREKEGQ